MCIITGAVRSVKQTLLFVAPSLSFYDSNQEPRQLTVYQNTVDTMQENLMILPVPYPDTVRFERDVMQYATLFEDLHSSLQHPPITLSAPATRSLSTRSSPATPLPVFDVGSYRVSVVPSVVELDRLNRGVFSLSEDLKELLHREYAARPPLIASPFGFLCCKLRAGAQTYEPLAYSHRRLHVNRLFVPTMHYHAHHGERELYGYSYFGEEFPTHIMHDADPHWDHKVYSIGTVREQAHLSDSMPKGKNVLNTKALPPDYQFPSTAPVHIWEKQGKWKNIDLEFPLECLDTLLERRTLERIHFLLS